MTEGHNVIEDYGHVGLTLTDRPMAFLRKDLVRRNIVTCEEAMAARGGLWLWTAGLVLVRQKPGAAKGVMFLTIEDEDGAGQCRRLAIAVRQASARRAGSRMMAINGRIQREGAVVHLIAQQMFDFSGDLSGLADLDTEFKLQWAGRRVWARNRGKPGITGEIPNGESQGNVRP